MVTMSGALRAPVRGRLPVNPGRITGPPSACVDARLEAGNENQMKNRRSSRLMVVALLAGLQTTVPITAAQQSAAAAKTPAGKPAAKPAAVSAEEIDRLLAPIALYPDQLLAQILMCAGDPA